MRAAELEEQISVLLKEGKKEEARQKMHEWAEAKVKEDREKGGAEV